ncbi:alkyl dihydroxyacetonephosphate synthase [Strigomonas culicis]|uniref:Alkylglycerone-phosphate synthase n=1 Tax=Strigomonas culicis TaxID=28005 RepID=S9UY62_9TRYP|nr:alkyldihydroxyacetonephosphate synthase [Strigomonas culicis]EPY33664.1 alkyl dihydroxyacetonephosphate synthase [Strigomonas culicis]|eukprot:EPY25497.1 alkyldihydroxyacetonephosphate synthase [Strigomonas culicis]
MSEKKEDTYKSIKWNGWGHHGAQMTLDENGKELMVRYLDGRPLPNMLDFVYKEMMGGKGPKEVPALTPSIPTEKAIAMLNKPLLNDAFLRDLAAALAKDQVLLDGLSRLSHICGKNYRDLWRVRRGMVERAPDCVVLPASHGDCVELMRCAQAHDVIVIPFGGGTNVTGGVEANPLESKRMVVSVDMRRMNRMRRIDKKSQLATFETGVLGPDLDAQLEPHGFMFGHDPDSYTHSTLGGWIGARGSGAMSNQYGDIEDMVVSVKVATPTGVIVTPLTSRTCGVDLNGLFIGSEGAFGIVTEATVKLERIPEVKYYEGYLFPSFEAAFKAFEECNAKGIKPCTMRLYDDDDFRMSLALSTAKKTFLGTVVQKGLMAYLRSQRGWDMRRISLVVLGCEGTSARVKFQRAEVGAVFRKHGGFPAGQKAGQGWQEKKYDLPYVRDFALSVGLWADVLETSVLYAHALDCWRAVKEAVRQVWAEHNRSGWVGCHTAHQYKFGCCLYFTFASTQTDENDLKLFLQLKTRATEAILKFQGNLTHHHGIGYEHVPWMNRYMGPGCMDVLHSIKSKLDPKNICNPGKLLPSAPRESESKTDLEKRQVKEQMFNKMGIPGALKAHLVKTSGWKICFCFLLRFSSRLPWSTRVYCK